MELLRHRGGVVWRVAGASQRLRSLQPAVAKYKIMTKTMLPTPTDSYIQDPILIWICLSPQELLRHRGGVVWRVAEASQRLGSLQPAVANAVLGGGGMAVAEAVQELLALRLPEVGDVMIMMMMMRGGGGGGGCCCCCLSG
jgi:hypothetical protein